MQTANRINISNQFDHYGHKYSSSFCKEKMKNVYNVYLSDKLFLYNRAYKSKCIFQLGHNTFLHLCKDDLNNEKHLKRNTTTSTWGLIADKRLYITMFKSKTQLWNHISHTSFAHLTKVSNCTGALICINMINASGRIQTRLTETLVDICKVIKMYFTAIYQTNKQNFNAVYKHIKRYNNIKTVA
jgi:hypothetical protein